MEDFIVDGKYAGYVFVGCAMGNVVDANDPKKKTPYYNMYVICPVSSYRSEDYQAAGFKAEKKKCISPAVWQELRPGDRVKLFFDDKGRVVMSALDE